MTTDCQNLDLCDTETYRGLVEKLAEANSPEVFSNGRAEHAAIIYETFLKYARSRLRIFCHNLSQNVYKAPIVQRMEAALNRGIQVEIITQEPPQSAELSEAVENWKQKNLQIKLFQAKPGSIAATMEANFAVMDGKAYRFEKDHKNHEAFACFCNKELATQLEKLFLQFRAELI